jgi:transcriptional regulator with XRE-family HTH domain
MPQEMTLDELRTSLGFTQSQLTQRLGISQAAVSKLEFRNDSYISSVRKFIEAIGGRMEIRAVLSDGTAITIRGLDGDQKITLLRSMIGKECRISPNLVGSTRAFNRFVITSIDDEERFVDLEKDSGHHVFIPIRRILEILPSQSLSVKSATLVINGRVEWLPAKSGWHFIE